mgnify:CR=1 FL=1
MKPLSKKYALTTLLLFGCEVAIAYYHFSPFVRGLLGDVLAIPLLYTFLKVFIRKKKVATAGFVLCFAFFVEFLQLIKMAEAFSLRSKILLTVMGSVFDPLDLLAYTFGFLLVVFSEKLFNKKYPSVFF